MTLNIEGLNCFYVGLEEVLKIYSGSEILWNKNMLEYVPNEEIFSFDNYAEHTTFHGSCLQLGKGNLTKDNAPIIKNLDFSSSTNVLVLNFIASTVDAAEDVLLFSCEGLDVLANTQMKDSISQMTMPYGYNLPTINDSRVFKNLPLTILFGYDSTSNAMSVYVGQNSNMTLSFYLSDNTSAFTSDILLGASSVASYASSMTKGLKLNLADSGYCTTSTLQIDANLADFVIDKPLMIPKI